MKHSILLTSLLLLSGSLAACSDDGGNDPATGGTGGTGGTVAGGTGGGGSPSDGGGGNPSNGGGGTGGGLTFCDAPTMIFQVEATTIVAGCTGAACHTAANIATFPPDLTSANPETRLLDIVSDSAFCGGGGEKYIDTANVESSLILHVLEPNPTCGLDGSGTIEQMPFGVAEGNLAPLTPAQKQCIVDWVHFVAAQ